MVGLKKMWEREFCVVLVLLWVEVGGGCGCVNGN